MHRYLQPVRPGAPDYSDPQRARPVDSITSAGSVFLGDWSPESAGDYASGTNHVLPTYGYTSTCSSRAADFQKRMTVQELSREGFASLASTIETLAAAERLTAHKTPLRCALQP